MHNVLIARTHVLLKIKSVVSSRNEKCQCVWVCLWEMVVDRSWKGINGDKWQEVLLWLRDHWKNGSWHRDAMKSGQMKRCEVREVARRRKWKTPRGKVPSLRERTIGNKHSSAFSWPRTAAEEVCVLPPWPNANFVPELLLMSRNYG